MSRSLLRASLLTILLAILASAAPQITTTTLPDATVGVPYNRSLSVSGAQNPVTWSQIGGSLPPGLTLASNGTISGTPTTAGTYNFTVRVVDNKRDTDTQALSITVAAPVTVTTSSLAPATFGVEYSQTLAATGGTGTYTWSRTAGALPAGLTLSTTGTISGTPTTVGTSSFTVIATDGAGRNGSKALSITVSAPPLSVTTASLPNAAVGAAYSPPTLSATGGTGGYSWSAVGLPAGLSLSASGAISGTPTTAGTANVTVTVTDNGGRTANKGLSLTVDPALTVSTASLPNGTVGVAYSPQTLTAAGALGGTTWAATTGSLPAGLALSASGEITGTPTAAGRADFTVTVTDSANRKASKALAITIDPALTVSTASLPNGTVGVAYSPQTLAAAGAVGATTWTITTGALPAGLTLSAAGEISGTPTAAGRADFTVTVTDSANRKASKALAITIDPALTVSTASLPNGTVGVAYSQTLAAAGALGGTTWAVTTGSLPAGLALSASGEITGTPTAAGRSDFTVTVTDSSNRTAPKALAITVDPPTLAISTASLPAGTVGMAYSQTLEATGGSGGNRWAVTAGALPAGLTLSAAGAITGTPTAAGSRDFTVTVTDSANRSASKALSLAINTPPLTITTTSLPVGNVGVTYSQTLAASGGTGGYSWTVTAGSLPAGLSLSSAGALSGLPVTPGTANFTAQVKDSANTVATKALSLTVNPALLSITTQSLPPAVQGSQYSQMLSATGGTGAYRWSVSAGNLPTGLALDPGGRIAGTVTGGSATFTVEVTDAAGVTADKNLSISVTPPLTLPPTTTLSTGVTGTSYTGAIVPKGGQPPYTFAVATGQLPPGLSLNAQSGEISGRPTQVGTFNFGIQVKDSSNAQTQSDYAITIANTLTITTPPVLPSGSISVAYKITLLAAGGTAPYSWSATGGSLPAGVTFRPDGTIEGTPTNAGSFTLTATVTDAVGGKASKDFTLSVAAQLTITTGPQLPSGVPGVPYNTNLAAAGGTAPFLWTISAGSLPAGLRIDAATGAITGVPEAPGTANFTATVTDSANVTAQRAFTLTVVPGVSFTTPATLPGGVAGVAYTFTLQATGGKEPYSWRITDGVLPEGLALTATSGVISGTPSSSGTFNFTIEATDAAGLKASRVHTLVVDLPSPATLRISGVPATLAPMQQPQVDIVLADPYPVGITGRLNLAFVPANGMPDDPSVQFSSGGRSVSFTIAANDTRASFSVPRLLMQSGSVAGTIQFTVESLRAGSQALPNPTAPIGSAQVPPAAVVRSVEVRRTTGGFDLVTVGASTTRELARILVRFRPPAGATLQTTEVTVDLADAAKAWFQSSNSAQYGGQFTLTLPFTFAGGPSAIESVTVVLTNSAGSSQEVSGPY